MARGWESKSVESQIESAESLPHAGAAPAISAEEAARLRAQESLQLSRTRVTRELEDTQNPRYRKLLERTLADLDARLARMKGSRST